MPKANVITTGCGPLYDAWRKQEKEQEKARKKAERASSGESATSPTAAIVSAAKSAAHAVSGLFKKPKPADSHEPAALEEMQSFLENGSSRSTGYHAIK